MRAYHGNRREAVQTAVEADTVAAPIVAMIGDKDSWEGTTSELMEALRPYLPNMDRPPRDYPALAQAMTGRLRRIAPALRDVGIERIDFSRQGRRRGFRLEKTDQARQNGQASDEVNKAVAGTSPSTSQTAKKARNRRFLNDEVGDEVTSLSSTSSLILS